MRIPLIIAILALLAFALLLAGWIYLTPPKPTRTAFAAYINRIARWVRE